LFRIPNAVSPKQKLRTTFNREYSRVYNIHDALVKVLTDLAEAKEKLYVN
jgi:hypothetical protein